MLPSPSLTAAEAVLQARASFGAAHLTDCAVLEIHGPDAARFLQNRLSSDVMALREGQWQMTAVLERTGKIQGIGLLMKTDGDRFLCILDAAEKGNAVAQIEKFHILEPFQIADGSGRYAVFMMSGPQADALARRVFQPNRVHEDALPEEQAFAEGTAFGCPARLLRHSRTGDFGYWLLLEAEPSSQGVTAITEAVQATGGVVLSPEAQEILRVEAGFPRFGREYTHETLLPETGLERVTVSYSKGCYLGQETIARIRTYGSVQKALTGLLLEPGSPCPPVGGDCLLNGKSVGTIQSAIDSPTLRRPIAIASLGRTERIPGRTLALWIDGREYRAEVTLLPFYDASAGQKTAQTLLDEGLKHFADGYDEEAIRVLERAIALDDGLTAAYEALGVILSRHERYEEAIAQMERVLALEPDHVLAHTNLSVFYMKLGDKDRAEEEKAKATMAAFSQKAKAAGLVFDVEAERRKQEQALQEKVALFEEALRFNPDDFLGNFGLASALLELKRYAEAIEPFQKALKAQPKHSNAYLSLGKAYEGAMNPQEAMAAYRKGIEAASARGDLMPLRDMQSRLERLEANQS